MPMYEFRCQDCGEDFEELVRADDEPVECPECGSASVCRKLSTFAHRSGGRDSGASAHAPASHGSGCGSCGGGHCGSCGH